MYNTKYSQLTRKDYEKFNRTQLFTIIRDFKKYLLEGATIRKVEIISVEHTRVTTEKLTRKQQFERFLKLTHNNTYIHLQQYNDLKKMSNKELINIIIALDCTYCIMNNKMEVF